MIEMDSFLQLVIMLELNKMVCVFLKLMYHINVVEIQLTGSRNNNKKEYSLGKGIFRSSDAKTWYLV